MSQEPRRHTEWRASFGPFTLSPSERLLERDRVPVRLGGRALDLLIALVDSAGETVSKQDLIAQVWPDVLVEEGSLRFHMVAIRKALGEGEGGSRYITNTTNKGYTFVASVERRELSSPVQPAITSTFKSVPAPATPVVGRDEEVKTLVANLLQRRLVSVVGPGGIGKTTVAIACAQTVARQFNGDVHFIDLSAISETQLVRSSVATAVGLQNRSDDLPAVATHLADRNTLIVLDCCEHVIAGAAELAEALIRVCPNVHILATSREPLRAEGELVYRLQPLAFPPEGAGTTAQAALAYPAVRLFVDRAIASCSSFELKDSDAPLASQLCRELDGIALAIELAAGRIEALGLQAITSHFDASVRLMWHGRRTAVPRQQTLGATLDWSVNLLSDDEKRLLYRLSVFAATFSLDAAIEICSFDGDRSVAIELIASLVSKSLVTVDAGEAALRYGMLDTTRSYCWKKLCNTGEEAAVSQRLACYFRNWAQQYAAGNLDKDALDVVVLEMSNLRAALEWHFRADEHQSDAFKLAASLCPLLLQLSKVAECARWAQTALSQMPAELLGSSFEMRLQGALGQSSMFSTGGGEAETAYRRGIELAEQLKDFRSTLHLLNGYVVLLHRDGRYTDALDNARKAQSLLTELNDMESRAIVDSLMGVALHLVGNVNEAMHHWERCFAQSSGASSSTTSKLGFDFHIRALCGLARSLWLTGNYSKAIAVAEETIAKARESGHAVTYCIALIWAGSVYIWARNVERLEEIAATIERVAKQHSLTPYLAFARITRGQLLIARRQPAEGVELIRSAVEVLHECRYRMVTSVSLSILAKGLSDMSLHSAALAMCDEVETLIQTCGDFLRMPELLSVRGYCLAAAGQAAEAEKSYRAAIELARSQEVKSGQIEAAVALAQHLIGSGRQEEARRLLHPLVAEAGDEISLDLSLARSLLG
ncbi:MULTISPECIES: winged helix-turn-helix domain-containing protein [Paraburkholderia]|uniref:ATP-binding protein n=1 Tax=Paraburkholderia TaxID=1822464 RepID=UPI002259372F|nr:MULTISPECIES: winged helix-turn-helix domain-containing protein [Paraburkholderia]MCX4162564.1 winged helix-turn-helix domain-containing protein [Paraburkholderia megapolitana]MDN7158059.1 helix-turn-helix transcriptional regulator [Paraburkholderia sp. CHISQ3]MDQ6495106.1 helix-turn-helix transcriptional regulator [Paraburkholderia megapolitana]